MRVDSWVVRQPAILMTWEARDERASPGEVVLQVAGRGDRIGRVAVTPAVLSCGTYTRPPRRSRAPLSDDISISQA